ncbi:MAG: YfiR family protein, partial [Zetaproteobacteria bacterium]
RGFGAALPTALLLLLLPAAAADEIDERLLEVLYLRNFILYCDWPGRHPPETLVILSRTQPAPIYRTMRDHHTFPLAQTRRCSDIDCVRDASVLFVARDFDRWPELRRRLAGRPVLTVSDRPGFVGQGGMIGLYRRNRRLRFAVNLQAVRAVGLHLSAELLQMADRVVE